MVKACLLLLAGGLAAQHTTRPLASDCVSLLFVASLCLLALRHYQDVAVLVLGYTLFMLAGLDVIEHRLDGDLAGDSMLARVRIVDFPKVTGRSVVMLVTSQGDRRIPPRVRVSWFDPPVLPAIGDVWELELRLRRPRGSFNPGVFDYETWLFREKIHATGYVVNGRRNRLLWSGTASALDRYRSRFIHLARLAANTDNAAAVLAAIGVGARHRIAREEWNRFAISGTSHLMAISGLHIGLAALASFGAAYAILGILTRQGNSYVAAILAGLFLAVVYAVVAGFGVPARRAVLMLAVVALTVVRRRQIAASAVLAFAATAVFITDPVATLAPGFKLSFAAVGWLLWLARRQDHVPGSYQGLRVIRQLLAMQVFLLFGLLPLTALIFQRFAVLATPVNLLAVPLFGFVTVPLTLSGMVVAGFSEPAALFLLRMAAYSIDGLEWFITRMVALPLADMTLARISGIASLVIFVPLTWVVLPRGWPGRWLAIIGIAAILSYKPPSPPETCFDAWVLDVGQGLAIAIRTQDTVLLYDTGMAWRSGNSAAEQLILPFLGSQRIDRLDRLVVSHADLDHSGGVPALRRELEIGTILAGEPVTRRGERHCEAGQRWRSGRVRFEMLHPLQTAKQGGNASSCVLRIAAGPHALLLTGDIEAASENDLLQRRGPLAADVVVVPHHGSLTSSTVPFTRAVRSRYAIVSAGYDNRWGFPKDEVVSRWQATGARVLDTASSGAIAFRVCAIGGVGALHEERRRRRRFWHART